MATTIIFRHESASAQLHVWNSKRASLSNVYSKKRRQGHATKLMRKIVKYADKHNLIVNTYADEYGPHTPSDGKWLVEFYKRFGFRSTSRKDPNWLRRDPSQKKLGM